MAKKPLLDIHCHYEPFCEYPVSVKLTMDDGTIKEYVLLNKTEYQFNRVMETLDRMTVGYPKKKRYRRR
jgi:hypothetical protein